MNLACLLGIQRGLLGRLITLAHRITQPAEALDQRTNEPRMAGMHHACESLEPQVDIPMKPRSWLKSSLLMQ